MRTCVQNNITAMASNINFPSMGSRLGAAPGSPAASGVSGFSQWEETDTELHEKKR